MTPPFPTCQKNETAIGKPGGRAADSREIGAAKRSGEVRPSAVAELRKRLAFGVGSTGDVIALGELGPGAEAAVPELRKLLLVPTSILDTSTSNLCYSAAEALGKIRTRSCSRRP